MGQDFLDIQYSNHNISIYDSEIYNNLWQLIFNNNFIKKYKQMVKSSWTYSTVITTFPSLTDRYNQIYDSLSSIIIFF